MFSHIRTSKENREIISEVTRKLSLGTENVVARLAIGYSLGRGEKLSIEDLKDSGGKEYSKSVLFGDYFDVYLGMVCTLYGIHRSDPDVGKYIKIHLDDGLNLVSKLKIDNVYSLFF